MTPLEKRTRFSFMLARLLLYMNENGYGFTVGEVYRSPEEARRLYNLYKEGKGPRASLSSLHTKGQAVDINLFKDGKYLASIEAHRMFGDWWERQHSHCRWGGRYGDGNHYEFLDSPKQ